MSGEAGVLAGLYPVNGSLLRDRAHCPCGTDLVEAGSYCLLPSGSRFGIDVFEVVCVDCAKEADCG